MTSIRIAPPGKRESDGKRKDLPITKKGSRLLRWAMVEAAWAAVAHSARWRGVYEALKRRRQAKRAIIAVARRLLTVLVSMLKSGTMYRASLAELREKEALVVLRANKKRAAKSKKEAAKAAKGAKETTMATLRLPSGEMRLIPAGCRATVGEVGNKESELISVGKAGRSRWQGKRPSVRGVAMNPIDHPLGGGEGKASGGRNPTSPWGKTEGRTRKKGKYSDAAVVRRRGAKRGG